MTLVAVLWEWQGQAAKAVNHCKEALRIRRALIFNGRDDVCDHIIQN